MTLIEQLRRADQELDVLAEQRLRRTLYGVLALNLGALLALVAVAPAEAHATWAGFKLLIGLLATVAGALWLLTRGQLFLCAALLGAGFLAQAVASAYFLPTDLALHALPVAFAALLALPYLRGSSVPIALAASWVILALTVAQLRGSWHPSPIDGAILVLSLAVGVLLWRLCARRDRYRQALIQGRALVESSQQQYRFLAEAIPQLVWGALPNGMVDYCNAHWVAHTGLAEKELLQGGWQAALHPDDVGAAKATWERSLANGEPYEQMQRLRRASDGSYRWFVARAVPIRDGAEVVRWIGSYTDVDDQKRAVEQLQESDRRKDEFLAVLGHELRNPLAPILTAVQLMQLRGNDHRATEKQRGIIERQVRQMVRLVDDLLDVSRISRNKIVLQREPIDFVQAVARAVDAASPLIVRRGHQLSLELPTVPVLINADAVRLEQVLINLLNNAAKYTEPGGRIRLTARVENEELVIRLKDNGIGLSAETQARLFQPFVQAEEGRELSRGGLGVGLSLVKSLVELHGGSVSVHSDGVGCGSEFTVRLAGVELQSEGTVPQGLSAVMQPDENANMGRVLVVDDNIDAAESLGEALQMEGYDVRVVHSGETAVSTAQRFAPDVVVLDIGLPQMDGYEVARKLRESTATRESFIVALTGLGQDGDRARGREAGFDEYLVKPVDLSFLYELLRPKLQPPVAKTG